jgi:hypothetical protein
MMALSADRRNTEIDRVASPMKTHFSSLDRSQSHARSQAAEPRAQVTLETFMIDQITSELL